ncbi:MAG: helix-turn-helix transcriptional regulator [Bacteroidales bacterium]|nr:helix-turn-helix transcriptional regulator [Bacteroidales bacterium]
MNTKELFRQSLSEVKPEIKKEMDISFAIADKLSQVLAERNLSQKEFAKQIGKTEPEVSRWLSGSHNFTIRTIAKLSAYLNEDLISVK